jgi:YfiR/HmsC-like
MSARTALNSVRAAALAIALAAASAAPAGLPAEAPGEYVVKAAFLFHFAQFVEWPPEAFKDPTSPLTYCTIGDDPFRGALEESVEGKIVGTHSLRVQHLKGREQIAGCQILFIGVTEKKRFAEDLSGAGGHAVLTVGESENFAESGGIIGFVTENSKVRFEINVETAGKAKLKISSRLLSLAKTVIGNQS